MSSRQKSSVKRSSNATGSKPSWKASLSEDQLEKKREKDRIHQRRTRHQSKEVATLFKDKMDLLMNGDHKTLLQSMAVDNEVLRTKITVLRSKLDHIHSASKECLDVADEVHKSGSSLLSRSSSHGPSGQPTENCKAFDYQSANAVGGCRKRFSRQPSIFLEIRKAMRHGTECRSMDITTHHFIEIVMAWKYSKGLTDGFEYLAQFYDVPTSPIEDALHSKTTPSEFYTALLNQLHDQSSIVSLDEFLVQAMREASPVQPQNDNLSYLDIMRCKTAYLAHQLVLPWRNVCSSHVEFVALFWAQCRHLLFFMFPSTENLAKCPVWYRPETTRLLQNHPGYIDFVIWPHIHERLTETWRQNDTEDLVRALIRGFHIPNMGTNPKEPIIYLDDSSELQVPGSFERAMAETSNFHTQLYVLAQGSDRSGDIYTGSHAGPSNMEADSSDSHSTLFGSANPIPGFEIPLGGSYGNDLPRREISSCPFQGNPLLSSCLGTIAANSTADPGGDAFSTNIPDIEFPGRGPAGNADTLYHSSPLGRSSSPSWLFASYE
ncbi:hypothetical protein BJX65DRAFT_234837 [Aspergillus insuetus]